MRAQAEVGGVHQPDRARRGTGPTRTTRPGAAEPSVSQGTSGTSASAGVQRPAQHTTSSASRTAPAAVRTRGGAPGSRPVTRPGSPVRTCAPWLSARATRRAISGSVSR